MTRPRLRACAACAARGPDTKFPSRRRRSPDLCVDCAREAARQADRDSTRASHPAPDHAGLGAGTVLGRQATASPQLDLIDLLVPPP